MIRLEKRLVDELLRITKKYYKTGDIDILPAVREAENELQQECKTTFEVIRLIGDLAKFSQRSGKGTYDDIYKALEVFEIIVKGKELE